MNDIQDVLCEMREKADDRAEWGAPWEADELRSWANKIEAAMREPVAYYWMSSKHRYEAHMADDLPCNATDMHPLFALPPEAAWEIQRLGKANLNPTL